MSPLAVQLMLKRRLRAAGLPKILSPHSFRVLVVTDLLSQNVPLEDVQYLAGHAHPRTTQIYDRRRRVSLRLDGHLYIRAERNSMGPSRRCRRT